MYQCNVSVYIMYGTVKTINILHTTRTQYINCKLYKKIATFITLLPYWTVAVESGLTKSLESTGQSHSTTRNLTASNLPALGA